MRVVVLASGAGTNLQALIDACSDPAYGASIVAVGADRDGIGALDRATAAGIETFVLRVGDYHTRDLWDVALAEEVSGYRPDLVVSAGFLKLAGAAFLERFAGRYVNTHPSLLPAFPGMAAPREALDYGVKVTGCTLFVVDGGIDTGPIIAQAAVDVDDTDDPDTLHERIKAVERSLLVDRVGRMARSGWRVDGRKVTIP
jgi:phosphoribosylglycinamide formyltransferase 1